MADFTHFDSDGAAHMVNVGEKPVTAAVPLPAARSSCSRKPSP